METGGEQEMHKITFKNENSWTKRIQDKWDNEAKEYKLNKEKELLKKEVEKQFNETINKKVIYSSETSAKPPRYNQGSLEVWDAIHQLGLDYRQGNVVKYVSRYKHKNGVQDLVKAINYIIKMIAEETNKDYYEVRENIKELLK
jgi:hypothetical protein